MMRRIISQRFLVFFLFFIFSFSVFAGDMILAPNHLAEKVLEKYQSFEAYHAQWMAEAGDSDDAVKSCWEVAFDRKTKQVLFSALAYPPVPEGQPAKRAEGVVLVVDRKSFDVAITYGPNVSVQKNTRPVIDPNQLNYRDVRRAIPFLYPFDLPLIFSKTPFMEVIQDQVKEIKEFPIESDLLQGFEVIPDSRETTARFIVDSNSLMIQEFQFVHSPTQKMKFTNKFVQVNNKLPDDLFDFEKQLKKFEIADSKKEN